MLSTCYFIWSSSSISKWQFEQLCNESRKIFLLLRITSVIKHFVDLKTVSKLLVKAVTQFFSAKFFRAHKIFFTVGRGLISILLHFWANLLNLMGIKLTTYKYILCIKISLPLFMGRLWGCLLNKTEIDTYLKVSSLKLIHIIWICNWSRGIL